MPADSDACCSAEDDMISCRIHVFPISNSGKRWPSSTLLLNLEKLTSPPWGAERVQIHFGIGGRIGPAVWKSTTSVAYIAHLLVLL
jgi:hypothetical protein